MPVPVDEAPPEPPVAALVEAVVELPAETETPDGGAVASFEEHALPKAADATQSVRNIDNC